MDFLSPDLLDQLVWTSGVPLAAVLAMLVVERELLHCRAHETDVRESLLRSARCILFGGVLVSLWNIRSGTGPIASAPAAGSAPSEAGAFE